LEKDVIQKSNMHIDGKSGGRAVPTKCPNKSGNPLAEGIEGSRSAEENTEQTTASQTQSWGDALSGLRGVREAAKKDKRLQFTALLHHVSATPASEGYMKLHARQKYDYRDLERGEAQLIRVGHALWRDCRKLGDTVSQREGINAALESVWWAKREHRAELAKKRASRFSEFRKALPQPCVVA
jgi:hypothetical protein